MLDKYKSRFNSEDALLLTLLIVAIYMFVGSFNLHPDAATFPRIMSGIIIILGGVLLFSAYLPTRIREYLVKQEGLSAGSMGDEEIQQELEESGEKMGPRSESMDRPLHPSVFTGLMTAFLLIGGYLIGLFWVAPVFAVGYLLWFRQPLWKAAIVLILVVVILLGFIEFLNAPFMQGELWDGVIL